MTWHEQLSETRQKEQVGPSKALEFDKVKAEIHPVITKEADAGIRPFQQLKFQPVIGHGIFEAEFATKADDIIFHVWPFGYRSKEREGKPLPKFSSTSEDLLTKALQKSFAANRVELIFDKDMGSYFVKALGYAKSLDPNLLAIDVCREFYRLSGGQP